MLSLVPIFGVTLYIRNDNYHVISFHSPAKIAEQKAKLIDTMAWKASRLCHIGASVMETHSPSEQTASSSMPLTWSNSGPISNVPTMLPTPVQMSIVDIFCVLLDVQTSISGSDVVTILKLTPYDHNDSLAHVRALCKLKTDTGCLL